MERFERRYVQALLDQEQGVVARAATRAGVPRQTFFRLIRIQRILVKYGLDEFISATHLLRPLRQHLGERSPSASVARSRFHPSTASIICSALRMARSSWSGWGSGAPKKAMISSPMLWLKS